jgi:hypothetical protein
MADAENAAASLGMQASLNTTEADDTVQSTVRVTNSKQDETNAEGRGE